MTTLLYLSNTNSGQGTAEELARHFTTADAPQLVITLTPHTTT